MILYTIETGGRTDIGPIQCYLEGGGETGGFQPTDLLTATMQPVGSTSIVFSPTASWYTADSTQTGYDQQQVETAVTGAQARLLMRSMRYILTVYRAPASDSTNTDIVAKILLIAKGPSDPK